MDHTPNFLTRDKLHFCCKKKQRHGDRWVWCKFSSVPSYLNKPSDVNRTGHAAHGSKLWDSAASGTFALVVSGATGDSTD